MTDFKNCLKELVQTILFLNKALGLIYRPTRNYVDPGMWPYTLDYLSQQVKTIRYKPLMFCFSNIKIMFFIGLSDW